LLWVSVRDRICSGRAFNRVFRLALSGLKIEKRVVGTADVRIWDEVLSIGARGISILALSRVRIVKSFERTAGECSIVKRDQESSFWTGWRINALLFLLVPIFTILAAHWRACSSDVPCSRRTMFSWLVADSEFWIPNKSFWTACEHRCSGHGIVPAFFALASSCFRIEDLTLQGTILRFSRTARIRQIWIRLRSVWTSARISFFTIADGAWLAAYAVRHVVVVKRESSIIADAPFQLGVPSCSFRTVFIETASALSEPCWFDR